MKLGSQDLVDLKRYKVAWSKSKHQAMSIVQVNLFQKFLFLHLLTHNMCTDCSWNYHENNKGRTWAKYVLRMYCACSFHDNSINNLLSYCGLVDGRISTSY